MKANRTYFGQSHTARFSGSTAADILEILTGEGFGAGRHAKRAPAVKEKPGSFLSRIVPSAKLLLV
jgi:hypothetical protein